MKYLFRVEGNDGIGPFNGDINLEDTFYIWDHRDAYKYPDIKEDLDWFSTSQLVGCPNACALFHWFGECFDVVIKHYSLYRIKVKDYKLGLSGHQLVYNPEDELERIKLYN